VKLNQRSLLHRTLELNRLGFRARANVFPKRQERRRGKKDAACDHIALYYFAISSMQAVRTWPLKPFFKWKKKKRERGIYGHIFPPVLHGVLEIARMVLTVRSSNYGLLIQRGTSYTPSDGRKVNLSEDSGSTELVQFTPC